MLDLNLAFVLLGLALLSRCLGFFRLAELLEEGARWLFWPVEWLWPREGQLL